jgi:predicted phage terminase large subunit-like protein
VKRRKVWNWFQGTFYNRIRPGMPIIVIQHRMHEDDLVGKLLEAEKYDGGDKWEVVNLAAHLDNPPWPQRYDRAALERIKANTDPRQWSALYMQDPTPESGDYFKREWFNDYEETPAGLNIYAASDYATIEGEGDYTEHGIFGVDFNSNVYVLDWWRGQTTSDVWIEEKCRLILKHRPITWFGESGVIRRAVEPFMMRRLTERGAFCNIEWLPSIADKTARARGFQARASMGKVFLPRHAPWKDDLMSQLMKFPMGKYDDGVDVCSLIGRGLDQIVSSAPRKPQLVAGANWMG